MGEYFDIPRSVPRKFSKNYQLYSFQKCLIQDVTDADHMATISGN